MQHVQTLLSSGTSRSASICQLAPGFVQEQRQFCRNHFPLMESVVHGYMMGLQECKFQFEKERWNCTGHEIMLPGPQKPRTYMDRLIAKSTRESAYVLAIVAAGVSHAVTKACSSGVHETCGCDRTVYEHPQAPNFKWSGCSDNIHFGTAFTRQFLDVREKRKMQRNAKLGLTNLHNNHVGRQSVMTNMRIRCKCHGVSGSCETRTCWRSVPSFRVVGTELKKLFEEATQVEYRNKRLEPAFMSGNRAARNLRPNSDGNNNPTTNSGTPRVTENNLIYLRDSPSFCDHNHNWGSLGTSGRLCNATDHSAADSCNHLCCQRNFIRVEYTQEVDCDCKFHWCCEVRCKKCKQVTVTATCN
jgi:wingless-type MMTV integration site family, member 4